jgi:hypothetical protein
MPPPFSAKIVRSSDVFKLDLFRDKVLFCTGGGSGICRSMTEAMVCGEVTEIMTSSYGSLQASNCNNHAV